MTMAWDFWSLNPESLHQVMILMSDRGIPYSYRYMHGFGSHTYSMINDRNEVVWIKFHFLSNQGIKCFRNKDAVVMAGEDPNWCQRDLVKAIEDGNYPSWTLKIQVMTQEQAVNFRFNPFDVTKVWPHKEFPLMEVGVMTLNKIPDNYFATVEQAAFAPSNFVDGISYSPDKMLQGRLFAYQDAHRYRLGANFEMLPVNRPITEVNDYQRDGHMNCGDNGGSAPNYFPNSFDNSGVDPAYKIPAQKIDVAIADFYDRNKGEKDEDYYTQPGALYRDVMDDDRKQQLVDVLVLTMNQIGTEKRDEIIRRQLGIFEKADPGLAERVAKGLNFEYK